MDANRLDGATIAFDLDGTLVDTAPDLIGALNDVLAGRSLPPLLLETARMMVGRGARALIERGFAAAGATLDDSATPSLVEEFIAVYLARIARESAPFDGLETALDRLSDLGARLCVCTNKRTDLSLALLDALDLTRRFAAVAGADAAPASKPDPRHLLTAVRMAGGDPARALMVGDSLTDVLAARACRIPIVLVSFGYTETPAAELDRDILIDRFDQLPAAALDLIGA